MKKTGILLTLFACFCLCMQAQKPKLNKEEFRARQEAFIIENARLTPQEAQTFFPLYFELQDKKSQSNREAWKEIRKGKQPDTSEEEYSRIIEAVTHHRRPARPGIPAEIQEVPFRQKDIRHPACRNEIPPPSAQAG